MESTAINSVYVVLHIVEESETMVDIMEQCEKGYLWGIYAREDDALKNASEMNSKFGYESTINNKTIFNKWIVIEKMLY